MSYIWNEAAETMPYEEIRELQGKRLVECVNRIYGHVPYYTEKMKAAGIEPGDIGSIDDLTKLPFTDKEDMRENYPYGTFAVPIDDIVLFTLRQVLPVNKRWSAILNMI